MSGQEKYAKARIESLANHITLPPQLPGRRDPTLSQLEPVFIDYFLESASKLGLNGEYDVLRRALQACKVVNGGGRLQKYSLVTALRQLQEGEFLILHIVEQNCGLVVHRDHEQRRESVLFEAFELSPQAKDVLASKNALQCQFPGSAVALSIGKFNDPAFQEELSSFLEKASTESIKRFAAHTQKAGSSAYESRDTSDPAVISQMLMALLAINGSRAFPPLIRKRVHDEVYWEGAENPWRRSPFWLLLRVAIQRHLCIIHGAEGGRVFYKFLVCLVISRLLDDALPHLMPEVLVHIKSKLCRRLVKLEVDRERSPDRTPYDSCFQLLRSIFDKSIASATQRVEDGWKQIKTSIKRLGLTLPKHADRRHLYLTLPNSGPYIRRILEFPLVFQHNPATSGSHQIPHDYLTSSSTAKPNIHFFRRYQQLSTFEENIEIQLREEIPISVLDCTVRIEKLAKFVKGYISASTGAYDLDTEQSSLMLLTIMDLWMSLDKCAVKLYPILKEFSPCFSGKLLELLQLPRRQDLLRLQTVRSYLNQRILDSRGSKMTIFDEPQKGCFAERFYNESLESANLQNIHEQIENTAQLARQAKEEEWEEQSRAYERLTQRISETTCLFTTDDFQNRVHDHKSCTKCFLERKARRFRITVHEHPLPTDPVLAKIAVFELSCPKPFALYRDTSWKIISSFALHAQAESNSPHILLQDYSELRQFSQSMNAKFSLGSTTKSFLMTHYSNPRFPVRLDDVCLPNGLKLKYFDVSSNSWITSTPRNLSFARHCRLQIPSNSPFASLQFLPEFDVDTNGPSTYQIISSQSKCPSGLNVHEYIAYQSLFSGKHRRWHQILLELGSSSLNFGTEATALLMRHLALQAGPARGDDPLGSIHSVFLDAAFCRRLIGLLDHRLDNIASNYRETNSMETLLTFILRIVHLSSCYESEALLLLEKARKITFDWVVLLRTEIQTATDAETSRRCSHYALWSSLLNRRTYVANSGNLKLFDCFQLKCYIEASIAMQDNMVTDPAKISQSLKNAIVRDMKLIQNIGATVRKSLEADHSGLKSAISSIWGDSGVHTSTVVSSFKIDEATWWSEITIRATTLTIEQIIHFHLLEGHLLVMGKPVGKLPVEYRTSDILQHLFGDQALLTYPSDLPGMNYRLAIHPHGYQIHLGFRNNEMIVRARFGNNIYELIPSHLFGGNVNHFDLPRPLVNNCVHWLDIHTGIIEIRQKPSIWKPKLSNWVINFYTRQANRRSSTLVDPHSPLANRVSQMFNGFEYRHELVVFQPEYRPLTVELRRLELSFFVNIRNLLESPQLRAEITLDQDAGTWHGLDSKIVLKEVIPRQNPKTGRQDHSLPGSQKTIIVPMGDIFSKRSGAHVRVHVSNNGDYARYTMNEVLGRIECPAEPRLLYLKALYHAYTSFVLPDELTGRTGTEEAIHCLLSGYCRPWTPLTMGPNRSLQHLADLTPKRVYYPKDSKSMQNVSWDQTLTSTIQSDLFRSIVEGIRGISEALAKFATKQTELPLLPLGGDTHLTERAHARRSSFQRSSEAHGAFDFPDLCYESRDRWQASTGFQNVIEIGNLLQNWPSKLPSTSNLAGILQKWPKIGGCNISFDKSLLSDYLELDIAPVWGSLIHFCVLSGPRKVDYLMFHLGMIAFREDVDMDIVRNLVAFAVLDNLKIIKTPQWSSFSHFRRREIPCADPLVLMMQSSLVPYGGDDRDSLGAMLSYKQRRKFESAELAHEQKQKEDCRILANFLLSQWPCAEISIAGFEQSVLIDIERALDVIRPEWLRLFQNYELSVYVSQVQSVLDDCRSDEEIRRPIITSSEQEILPSRLRGGEFPCLQNGLLTKCGGSSQINSAPYQPNTKSNGDLQGWKGHHKRSSQLFSQRMVLKNSNISTTQQLPAFRHQMAGEIEQLQAIFYSVANSKSHIQQQYGKDLMASLDALRLTKTNADQRIQEIEFASLMNGIDKARSAVKQNLQVLQQSFERDDARASWLQKGGLWPATTPVTLLENLRSISICVFGTHMRKSLIKYALSITELQRLLRLDDARLKRNLQKMNDEQRNVGHTNWDPRAKIDWLLLEIDSNMMLREIQVVVANATIAPSSGSNSVLQMNMGEGKTSCIMPMAAAVLANGKELLRVIVPKALLLQTAQTLTIRLGGLVGRQVCHLPFSRKTPTDLGTINTFDEIHRRIQENFGIMLALPEHLLSFSLSGLQRLSDDRISESKSMIQVQDWMNRNSRDILDECDNILAIRTQLIYPSGSQKVLDGHPHRWEVIETLLSRIDGHLWNLQQAFPHSLEVVRRFDGAFPMAYFLRRDVEEELISRLITDIIYQRVQILPPDCSRNDRQAIRHFISEPKVTSRILGTIKRLFPEKPAVQQIIHLLRGLFVHRILLMVLKKRWNVQYGLHPGRDPIAVPFMAKGTPSEQAEWGHPDVMVTMTCLAFYYNGLSISQLRQTLEHIVKSDDPSQAYHQFAHRSTLPDSLREWNAINVDDEAQIKDIWQHIRYETGVVDYFLNNFVFPAHAKQFQMKLQASGWDLPLFSASDQLDIDEITKRKSLTTGFSGTNDWKRMLPLTIEQNDLAPLAHTNAEVLAYLLEPRNRNYVVAADDWGRHISEHSLLYMIKERQIRVLIDAGAQIQEMDNLNLCKAWLEIDHEAPAAVYFDSNKPSVIYRNGHKLPLLVSPYADDLADCLVYLDEAHTRGTDLKFSSSAVGALTLSLGQTKDHTVQAAMRLRQLGTTQSVVFFAPPEVHQSILDLRKKKSSDRFDSYDVICWLLEQTCNGIEQLQPLFFSQGAEFCRRIQASLDNANYLRDVTHRDAFLLAVRTIEQQTLEKLYGDSGKNKIISSTVKFSPSIAGFMKELKTRKKGFQDFGNAVHGSALQEVEQEREVAYEVEAVREVQKPVHYSPYEFPGLHRDIEAFAKTGRLPAGTSACIEAFCFLGKTALGQKHGINTNATSCRLLVSHQFTRTINPPKNRPYDQFQRPVNWILWSTVAQLAVVVIPEEAELLLPLLNELVPCPTHLASYAAPITRKMLHFNDLHYYAVPHLPLQWQPPMWLRVELGIFSGRLYFEFFEYDDIKKFLGIKEDSGVLEDDSSEDSENLGGSVDPVDVGPDQHTNMEHERSESTSENNSDEKQDKPECFTRKPLAFLQEWLSIRRKGQDFAQTPMGFVCQGKPLKESHSFFSRPDEGAKQPNVKQSRVRKAAEEEDDADEDFSGDDDYGVEVGADEVDDFNDEELVSEVGEDTESSEEGTA